MSITSKRKQKEQWSGFGPDPFKVSFSNTTGDFNTASGNGANVSVGNLTNATAIGSGATVNASNKVRLGNVSDPERI